MSKPVIAIVGRPNVGKSTLFNRLAGKSRAITRNFHGVTRDRNYSDINWDDSEITLIDTGGFYHDVEGSIYSSIKKQALYAIEEADLIIHLLDGKDGLNPLDIELAKVIRKSGRKTLWVVNKIDSPNKEDRISDFYSIGAEELLPISSESGLGIDELMDKALSMLPKSEPAQEKDYPSIAIVGRPNVGKSTIVNTLLGKERMIVSPSAGTTRDSIDSICKYYGNMYRLIDTAGIRRRPKIDEPLEETSVLRSIKSIERADVVIAVLDATRGIVDQDQRIIGIAFNKGKGLLILFNKWDLIVEREKTYKKLIAETVKKLWYVNFAPVLTVSALNRKRIFNIFPVIDEILSERNKRIPTAELNRFRDTIGNVMPTYRGKRVKVFYVTQVATAPPAFALFVNIPAGIKKNHKKMIESLIREKYDFKGTPIKLFIRGRR